MTDAPERIWAKVEKDWHDGETGEDFIGGTFDAGYHKDGEPYIRADLAPAWRRIDDPDNTPPRNGMPFLVWYMGDWLIVWGYEREKSWCCDDPTFNGEFTWWRHLDTPPDSA